MSWYSGILTKTTSQISNLQRQFITSENDGDTEDDTHVCRVLRTYYTEQGRPFPGWLPPDPKAPPPAAPVYTQQSSVGSRYGGLSQQGGGGPGQQGGAGGGSGSGFGSLWDSDRQQGQGPASLRQGGRAPPMRSSDPPARQSPFARNNYDSGRDDVQARPLPSQRAGSYQTTAGNNPYGGRGDVGAGNNSTSTLGSAAAGGGGGSAQDRLKQRLWGGARTTSPSSQGGQGPFQPPAGSGRYGGGGGDKPFVSANAPWASGEDDYGGGGGGRSGGGPPSGSRRAGLPSGPRMR